MGCYLVCHFSGLWASLMSTLIPLRSGAGVYATLKKEKKKQEKEKGKKKCILFSARDLWAVVSSADPGDLVFILISRATAENSWLYFQVTAGWIFCGKRMINAHKTRVIGDTKKPWNISSQPVRFLWIASSRCRCRWQLFFYRFICSITFVHD